MGLVRWAGWVPAWMRGRVCVDMHGAKEDVQTCMVIRGLAWRLSAWMPICGGEYANTRTRLVWRGCADPHGTGVSVDGTAC